MFSINGVPPEYPADHEQALAWFTTERAVLLAAVDRAATTGFDNYAWRLVWTLEDFLDRRGHWHDRSPPAEPPLAAAGRQAGPNGQADAVNLVGWYHAQLGDRRETLISCEQALTLYRRLRDRPGQATTWDSLGYAHHHLGDHDRAVICYQHAIDLYQDLHQTRHRDGRPW